ncbi:MFS transporter [Streptomyces sp. NPDC050738]|uniref:MFS transporter n=1 Tax=Streptomyces sp. NPDC050738 TaxID=3154744 RepID=UPI0034287115
MSYAAVLRLQHARATFGAALLGRLSYGTVSLSLTLAVQQSSGSYAVAGTAMALFGAASVFLSPLKARLIDHHGPRRVLLPLAALYAAALALLTALTWRPGANSAALGALALLAGALTPPLGPTMRTVWRQLAGDRADLLRRAYSLDGVAEELLFVSGPLLVGALLLAGPPALGVALSAGLVGAGTAAFLASPAVRAMTGSGPGARQGSAGVVRGVAQPVLLAAGVGLALGALDLLVLAFADDRGHTNAVAWVMAALSVGSAAGGLANGSVDWKRPAQARLPLFALGLAGALAAAAFAPGLLALGAVALIAGLFVAPAITTAYLVADETVGDGARTQAGAWVNTAVNAGISGGTAGVGLLVGRLPVGVCFGLAAAAVVGAVGLSRLGVRTRAAAPASA